MRTKEELQHFYTTQLSEDIAEVEAMRLKAKKAIVVRLGIVLAVAAVYFVLITIIENTSGMNLEVVLKIGIFGLIGFSIMYSFLKFKKIEQQLKERIIAPLIQFVNPSFEYTPANHVSREEFIDANFFNKNWIDVLLGDDLVEGYVGSTHVRFSELNAKKIERTNDKTTRAVPVFQGLFFVFDFKKDFEGSLYVMPKLLPFGLDRLSRVTKTNLTREKMGRVEMESGLFNDMFDVRSTDQHTARYVLTPLLMENLMNLQGEAKHHTMFSFVNGKMYLALNTGKSHFSFNLFSEIDEQNVSEYFNDLIYTFSIVDELRLNERLWNK